LRFGGGFATASPSRKLASAFENHRIHDKQACRFQSGSKLPHSKAIRRIARPEFFGIVSKSLYHQRLGHISRFALDCNASSHCIETDQPHILNVLILERTEAYPEVYATRGRVAHTSARHSSHRRRGVLPHAR